MRDERSCHPACRHSLNHPCTHPKAKAILKAMVNFLDPWPSADEVMNDPEVRAMLANPAQYLFDEFGIVMDEVTDIGKQPEPEPDPNPDPAQPEPEPEPKLEFAPTSSSSTLYGPIRRARFDPMAL